MSSFEQRRSPMAHGFPSLSDLTNQALQHIRSDCALLCLTTPNLPGSSNLRFRLFSTS